MSLPSAHGARTSTAARCRCGRRSTRPTSSSRSACCRRCMTRSGCTRRSRRACLISLLPCSALLEGDGDIFANRLERKSVAVPAHNNNKMFRRRMRMIWKPELDDLARREAFAREMGGVDKVKRQRDQGRLTVRERIDKLADNKQFSRDRRRLRHRRIRRTRRTEASDAGELRVRPRARSMAAPSSWSATISRCAAVRPTHRFQQSR